MLMNLCTTCWTECTQNFFCLPSALVQQRPSLRGYLVAFYIARYVGWSKLQSMQEGAALDNKVHLMYFYRHWKENCKWFEPRSISSLCSVIVHLCFMKYFTVVFHSILSWLNWPISFNRQELYHCLTNTTHLTLKGTSTQVVETSVTNNSSFQNDPHLDDHTSLKQ